MLLKCRCKIRGRIAVVYSDLRNASPFFNLEPPCASFKTNPLHKLIYGFVCVLFEHPHKMILGITAVSCHIVHGDFLIQMFEDEINSLIDHGAANDSIIIFHCRLPAFHFPFLLPDQKCRNNRCQAFRCRSSHPNACHSPDSRELISYPKDAFHVPKALRAFISTDVSLSTREILDRYMERWPVEVFFRQSKNQLAFDRYQICSSKGIRRYWLLMSLLIYSYLSNFVLSSTKKSISF